MTGKKLPAVYRDTALLMSDGEHIDFGVAAKSCDKRFLPRYIRTSTAVCAAERERILVIAVDVSVLPRRLAACRALVWSSSRTQHLCWRFRLEQTHSTHLFSPKRAIKSTNL